MEGFFDEAHSLVSKDRAVLYGSGLSNMARIATLWSAYVGIKITPKDVAAMMILHKVSRLSESRNQTANTHDSWLDIAGYASLGDSVK